MLGFYCVNWCRNDPQHIFRNHLYHILSGRPLKHMPPLRCHKSDFQFPINIIDLHPAHIPSIVVYTAATKSSTSMVPRLLISRGQIIHLYTWQWSCRFLMLTNRMGFQTITTCTTFTNIAVTGCFLGTKYISAHLRRMDLHGFLIWANVTPFTTLAFSLHVLFGT